MPAQSKKARLIQVRLAKERGAWDYEDPEYPREDWRYDVECSDTQLGYFDWVIHNLWSANSLMFL